MTEPRHCQDCCRAPVVSYEFSNSISPGSSISTKGPVALTCPNCLSSTPRFDNYREALTSWNLKQISAEELYELRQRHRTELREEIREELKEELRKEIRQELKEEITKVLYIKAIFMPPSLEDIISMVSNM